MLRVDWRDCDTTNREIFRDLDGTVIGYEPLCFETLSHSGLGTVDLLLHLDCHIIIPYSSPATTLCAEPVSSLNRSLTG